MQSWYFLTFFGSRVDFCPVSLSFCAAKNTFKWDAATSFNRIGTVNAWVDRARKSAATAAQLAGTTS